LIVTELEKPDSRQYIERVLPNFGTFAAVFVLLPSTVIISEPFDLRVGLIIGILGVGAIWALLILRAPVIEVSASALRVGLATIPRVFIGDPVTVSKSEIFAERGPNLDPAAHKVFQGSVKTAVKIPITDPDDPTPYWLVSTRHPAKLAEILRNS
jgi:hypothetical protein